VRCEGRLFQRGAGLRARSECINVDALSRDRVKRSGTREPTISGDPAAEVCASPYGTGVFRAGAYAALKFIPLINVRMDIVDSEPILPLLQQLEVATEIMSIVKERIRAVA